MTVTEMHDWFNLIQDKVDSVYFTTSEIDEFLNRAQQMYVNGILMKLRNVREKRDMTVTLTEATEQLSKRLSPLVHDITVTPGSSDKVTFTEMSAEVSSKDILDVLRVKTVAGEPARFIRQTSINRNEDNSFKKSASDKLVYYYTNEGIVFVTAPASGDVNLTVLVEPQQMIHSSATDTDLPLETHDDIVAMALSLAGFGSMDELLIQIRGFVA